MTGVVPYRVLIPTGRPLEAVLSLPLPRLASEALALLAGDPRPAWAAVAPMGYRCHLPDGSWLLWEVDDTGRQVTVLAAGQHGRPLAW